MAVFKCKMCGGTIEFTEGATVGICDSCGTKQTLPNVNDEAIGSLYNRANTLRMKSEFDRAEEMYNKIISVDEKQAEAYWGIILCKYGIEYVEDPKTFKRVPTCHRASFDAITADEDYKLAIKYGDPAQKELYKSEAKEIDSIQKDILKIAKNEKPFDVFICYKETDENGKRTQDSVIANDIYHQLTLEGFKVFYSAITLEDKLGQEYEPYIFAALNSAKVMLVVGSRPEYFTAVWVKNEWSRFLKIMKTDRSKLLIPCYKDMDAYELPDDFAHLQAQDMGKIGFINDITRGIKKVIVKESAPAQPTVKETVVMQNENGNVQALLDRGFMALEDGEWEKADGFFEQSLNFDAKIARAYLGKLMAELRVKKEEDLKNCDKPFDSNNNCIKAGRFDKSIAKKLEEDNKIVKERFEQNKIDNLYNNAVSTMNTAKTETEFNLASKKFKEISSYKDSEKLAKECLEKAENARKDTLYDSAIAKKNCNNANELEAAIKTLNEIGSWKNSEALIQDLKEELIKTQANNKLLYDEAIRLYMLGDLNSLKKAKEIITSINGFEDSEQISLICNKKIKNKEIQRLVILGITTILKYVIYSLFSATNEDITWILIPMFFLFLGIVLNLFHKEKIKNKIPVSIALFIIYFVIDTIWFCCPGSPHPYIYGFNVNIVIFIISFLISKLLEIIKKSRRRRLFFKINNVKYHNYF